MSNVYSATLLQDARAFILDENNKKFQLRPNMTDILSAFTKDREFTIPALDSIRKSTTQATKAMFLKKKDFTIKTDKACSITGETSGSGDVTLSWINRGVEIGNSFKQHAGNEVSMMKAFANDLYNAEVSLWDEIDTYLLAYLETNKSAVNNGRSGLFTDDVMFIEQAKKQRFYNMVAADMKMNNYNPRYSDVFDTYWLAEKQYFLNQGTGNSENLSFQQALGFDDHATNLITNFAIGNNDVESIHYLIPTGGVAFLDWNDPLNVKGAVSGEKAWGTYQSLLRPEFTFDLFKTTECADTSSIGGAKQDLVEKVTMSLNFSVAKQPVPTVDETPIYKYAVLKSAYVS
jgi:hypothetical protein